MTPNKSTNPNKSLKTLSVKVVLLGASLLLLISSIVYLTVAWYTKMVSVSGLNFHVAKWDYSANFAIDNVEINVYEYTSMTKGHAAPGTGGYIPLELAAWQSDTDIEYSVSINKDAMSEEFQKRIFFYYYDEKDVDKITKLYFGGSPENPNENNVMTGTIARNGKKTVYIYWEWIYEAPTTGTAPADEAAKTAWDEFDTKVGKNPDLYKDEMTATISIAGVEVNPEEHKAESTSSGTN